MKIWKLTMLLIFLGISSTITAKEDEKVIPPENAKWDNEEDPDRSLSSSPSLFKDANSVYVYSEKQLDNLTIGITDMQGNTYHYEVTTLPDGCCFETLWIYRNRIKLQQKYCRHLC